MRSGDVLPAEMADALAAMVQQHGLAAVVDTLGEIAHDRVQHTTGHGQENLVRSRAWGQAANALYTCWRQVYGDAAAPAPLPW